MFIMYGWVKETKNLGPALSCHCYRCQTKRTWEHWKEIEWVSFVTIKTIPFLSKSYLVCSTCRQSISLDSERARRVGLLNNESRLTEFLEEHQLVQKSAVQRNFLMAQREQNQFRE